MSTSPIYGSGEPRWVLCLRDHEHTLECGEVQTTEPAWAITPVAASHQGRYRTTVPRGWLHEVMSEDLLDLQFGDLLQLDLHGKQGRAVYVGVNSHGQHYLPNENSGYHQQSTEWLEKHVVEVWRNGKVRRTAGGTWDEGDEEASEG